MADLGDASLDELLGRTRHGLEAMRGRAKDQHLDTDERESAGEAAEGRVRAVVRGGSLVSLQLDPRVMRMASEELAEHVVSAVNGALAQARSAAGESPATVDPAALAEQLAGVHEQSLRQMAAVGAAMTDALARMRQARS